MYFYTSLTLLSILILPHQILGIVCVFFFKTIEGKEVLAKLGFILNMSQLQVMNLDIKDVDGKCRNGTTYYRKKKQLF